MSAGDRERWDARYAAGDEARDAGSVGPPARLVAWADLLPTGGPALELACGTGDAAVWLAGRGLDVHGVDVSPVAVARATARAAAAGVADRCRFTVWDLDAGLPPGPPAALVLGHRFRDARLDGAVVERLAPGGTLIVVALSEVGAGPGRFREPAGGLTAAFGADPRLRVAVAGEADGEAWLVAHKV